MELTQKDFEDRKARVDAGTGDDEDRRLVKHYEEQGFTVKGDAAAADAGRQADAARSPAADRGTAQVSDDKTAGRGRTTRDK